jgi:hypothetical protein
MQEYPVKRGFTKDLSTRIPEALKECFEKEPERSGNHFRIRYGALRVLDVSAGSGGKTLIVNTESDKEAADEVIMETNRRFRKYLETVTGFSSKERVKRAKNVIEE